jgi:predicted transposase/invertase (TIGR01784 family)
MGKYLDPRAGLTFKKIFGEHKHLVISLLNAMLPLKEDEQVESIEYWPAEKVPDRMQAEKDSIVDVCCKDNKQREFIVEMQMTWTDSFKKRVLLNASKAYVAQSKKGDDYELLQPVYALNFVNENFMNDVDEYYHYYHLVHDKYTDKVIYGLHLIFVELKKFKPQTYAEKKMQVLWLRFLTEINDETREVPAELLENAEVSEALEIVERAAFDDAEMRAYDKFWDNVSVQKTLDNARKREINAVKREAEKAKAEAEEAKTKLKQEKFDTARKLKAMNVMTTEQIAEVTGLSNAEIEAL